MESGVDLHDGMNNNSELHLQRKSLLLSCNCKCTALVSVVWCVVLCFHLQLFQSYRPYDDKVGERQVVLVTEVSHDEQYYVAHNKFYEQVSLYEI